MSTTYQPRPLTTAPREAVAALAIKQRVMPGQNLLPLVAAGLLHFSCLTLIEDDESWAWIVSDPSGKVSASHHLSGPAFEPIISGDPSWPIGIEGARLGNKVAIVFGGADFIAAPRIWNDGTAVVAMVNDSPISDEALHLFAGREVEMADCGEATRKQFETWRSQLRGIARRIIRFAGADGQFFSNGRPARSVADLARIEWEQITNRGKPLPQLVAQ